MRVMSIECFHSACQPQRARNKFHPRFHSRDTVPVGGAGVYFGSRHASGQTRSSLHKEAISLTVGTHIGWTTTLESTKQGRNGKARYAKIHHHSSPSRPQKRPPPFTSREASTGCSGFPDTLASLPANTCDPHRAYTQRSQTTPSFRLAPFFRPLPSSQLAAITGPPGGTDTEGVHPEVMSGVIDVLSWELPRQYETDLTWDLYSGQGTSDRSYTVNPWQKL